MSRLGDLKFKIQNEFHPESAEYYIHRDGTEELCIEQGHNIFTRIFDNDPTNPDALLDVHTYDEVNDTVEYFSSELLSQEEVLRMEKEVQFYIKRLESPSKVDVLFDMFTESGGLAAYASIEVPIDEVGKDLSISFDNGIAMYIHEPDVTDKFGSLAIEAQNIDGYIYDDLSHDNISLEDTMNLVRKIASTELNLEMAGKLSSAAAYLIGDVDYASLYTDCFKNFGAELLSVEFKNGYKLTLLDEHPDDENSAVTAHLSANDELLPKHEYSAEELMDLFSTVSSFEALPEEFIDEEEQEF